MCSMLDALAIVYDPPRAGLPYLATLFADGHMLACEPVSSIDEGEAFLKSLFPKLPGIIDQIRSAANNPNVIAAASQNRAG